MHSCAVSTTIIVDAIGHSNNGHRPLLRKQTRSITAISFTATVDIVADHTRYGIAFDASCITNERRVLLGVRMRTITTEHHAIDCCRLHYQETSVAAVTNTGIEPNGLPWGSWTPSPGCHTFPRDVKGRQHVWHLRWRSIVKLIREASPQQPSRWSCSDRQLLEPLAEWNGAYRYIEHHG